MVQYWKGKYCHAGYEECARYQRSNAGKLIPLTLLPNGRSISASALKPRRKG